MTRPDAPAPSRRAWILGGVLVLGSAVVSTAFAETAYLIPGGQYIGTVVFAAALLVFAFGIRGGGSVTAKRPLGTAALAVLAAWAVLVPILEDVMLSGDYTPDLFLFGYVDPIARFILAGIVVAQVARARVVPHPWNWAPTWALAAVTVPWLVEQVMAIAMRQGRGQDATSALLLVGSLDSALRIGATLFLGVLAIVLGNRPVAPQRVTVYPPARSESSRETLGT